MTRDEQIQANDQLRQFMRGGRVEVCHGPYELDDRLIGRVLVRLGLYNTFDDKSLHDHGVFIFSGFSFEWRIETVDAERVLRVWVNRDVLAHAG
jgi:hypothetical protein